MVDCGLGVHAIEFGVGGLAMAMFVYVQPIIHSCV